MALASAAASSIWFGAPLAPDARIVLIVFSLATIGWTMTAIDDTLIALAAAATLVATRTVPTEQLYLALGSELIWLSIGSFVIAAALRASGLAERLALSALQPFSRVSSLFFAVTFVIIATAFLVPSTSGRAALLLPVYLALAEAIDDRRINRALAPRIK
ncbi:SLC13 family permease [Bosea sp. BIWAKO-01]|uniref:SLC13 family permease n=1 Tax=Bosea sp. BIWAKO-01 TaxID=506668 RepID=UPI000853814B|nr:SLC13 family permease [Bosea sp. BIWAKO-01]GAU82967.1 integral membrane transporter protein [Bosea sp. BIWAKO-01]